MEILDWCKSSFRFFVILGMRIGGVCLFPLFGVSFAFVTVLVRCCPFTGYSGLQINRVKHRRKEKQPGRCQSGQIVVHNLASRLVFVVEALVGAVPLVVVNVVATVAESGGAGWAKTARPALTGRRSDDCAAFFSIDPGNA